MVHHQRHLVNHWGNRKKHLQLLIHLFMHVLKVKITEKSVNIISNCIWNFKEAGRGFFNPVNMKHSIVSETILLSSVYQLRSEKLLTYYKHIVEYFDMRYQSRHQKVNESREMIRLQLVSSLWFPEITEPSLMANSIERHY